MSDTTLLVLWLIIAAVMFVIEIMTVSLVSIWFVAGALVAALLALLHTGWIFQLLAFLIVSALLFIFCKDRLVAWFSSHRTISGAKEVVGKTGVVSVPITDHGDGRVVINGQDWRATSPVPFAIGTPIKVVDLHGVTLTVTALHGKKESAA
ncbi:MAG: NfeD family protein [Allobaculum sp.]